MQTSVEQARATSSKLKEQVADLRRKIQEAERNASTLIARKNAAKAQKKVDGIVRGYEQGALTAGILRSVTPMDMPARVA